MKNSDIIYKLKQAKERCKIKFKNDKAMDNNCLSCADIIMDNIIDEFIDFIGKEGL